MHLDFRYKYSLGEYARLVDDAYFPVVKFFEPNVKQDVLQNRPNFRGQYPDSLLEQGWTRIYETDLVKDLAAKDGFYGVYYCKGDDTRHGVIVFRGTDDVYDAIWHDAKIAVGEWPIIALDHAREFYRYIMAAYKPEYLTFAGHSLGGALAQLVAHEVNKEFINFPSKHRLAVCFNAPQMGYLIKHNPQKIVRAELNIDNLVLHEKASIQQHIEQKHFGKTIEDVRFGLFFGAKYLGSSVDIIRQAYNSLINVKDLALCPQYSQPAFNTIFHMLRTKQQKQLLNKVDFMQSENSAFNSYPYVFNVNSLFDLVRCVGVSMGRGINLDLDQDQPLNHARLRNELRTYLTMQQDYLFNSSQYLIVDREIKTKDGSVKLEECTVSVEQKLLAKQTIDDPVLLVALSYLLGNDYKAHDFSEDLKYILAQHSMSKLARKIKGNYRLNNLNIFMHPEDMRRAVESLNERFNFGATRHEIADKILLILKETKLINKIRQQDCMPVAS